MQRLTKRDETNEYWQENHDNDTHQWKNSSRECMGKLAQYEDAEDKGFIKRCVSCGSLYTVVGVYNSHECVICGNYTPPLIK